MSPLYLHRKWVHLYRVTAARNEQTSRERLLHFTSGSVNLEGRPRRMTKKEKERQGRRKKWNECLPVLDNKFENQEQAMECEWKYLEERHGT